jgi:hypothetical protein
LLQQDVAYPTFLCQVLQMDEACFTLADVNPCSFRETWFQQQFVINFWAGTTGDILFGPYELLLDYQSLQFTVSLWTITTTTGWNAICNTADNVGTAWWVSCPVFSRCM